MIRLTEDQQIQTIENWDQMRSRPGFQVNVNPLTVQLIDIIGVYDWPTPVRCGLSTCHRSHMRGFLVSLTKGLSTNIGHICGGKRFGKSYKDAYRNYRADNLRRVQRALVDEAKGKLPLYRNALDQMVNSVNGAKWAYKCSQPLRQRTTSLPDRIYQEVLRMIRARSGAIYIERRLTDDERAVRRMAGAGEANQLYVREQVETLDGIQALFPENSLRELIVNDLSVELDRLDAVTTDTLPDRKLSEMSKLAADIQNRISRATEALPLYVRLLSRENVLCLEQLVDSTDDRKLLREFAKSLPSRSA